MSTTNGRPEERKPLLANDQSGGYYMLNSDHNHDYKESNPRAPAYCEIGDLSTSVTGRSPQTPQHLIIQPIEFDHKHKNMYGYLALVAAVLVLVSYLMIKERACQVSLANGAQRFDLIQSFHMITLIVAIIVFVLSYFNFAIVLNDFKLIFYATAALMFVCSGLLVYDTAAIVSAPCVSIGAGGNSTSSLLAYFGSLKPGGKDIFRASDGVGIAVFVFDLLAACVMFLAGCQFYKKR